jgi:hypothetical protein
MNRRFAARELHQLGLSFDFNQPIDRPLHLFQWKVFALGSAVGVTHGAFQIARRGDLDQSDTRMLFMLGTEPAIEGAPMQGLQRELDRNAGGQHVLKLVELRNVGTDEILADAMRGTPLAKIDASLAIEDLDRN